jgi:hypothetical protein
VKLVLTAFFIATSALAQSTASLPSACGPENVRLNVRLNQSPSSRAMPEPNKANVYCWPIFSVPAHSCPLRKLVVATTTSL